MRPVLDHRGGEALVEAVEALRLVHLQGAVGDAAVGDALSRVRIDLLVAEARRDDVHGVGDQAEGAAAQHGAGHRPGPALGREDLEGEVDGWK